MTSTQRKQDGLETVAGHHPSTLAMVMNEIEITRKCRLRTHAHQETFTVESLVNDVQGRVKLPIPTALNSNIGAEIRRRNLAEEVGPWVKADRDEAHDRRVPLLRWAV